MKKRMSDRALRRIAGVVLIAAATLVVQLGASPLPATRTSLAGRQVPGESQTAPSPSTGNATAAEEHGNTPHKKSHKEKPYALIFGTVWDAHNRAVPGVKVKIRRATDKKPKWELISDARGEFAQRVPPGSTDYLVWAQIKGNKGPVGETKVHVDNDERQDIGLHLPE